MRSVALEWQARFLPLVTAFCASHDVLNVAELFVALVKHLQLAGMGARGCIPRTLEPEAGGPQFTHQPRLSSETLSPKNKPRNKSVLFYRIIDLRRAQLDSAPGDSRVLSLTAPWWVRLRHH